MQRWWGEPDITLQLKTFDAFDEYGGEGGIRTPDTLSGMPVFKTGAINHSATSPVSTVLLQTQFYGRNPHHSLRGLELPLFGVRPHGGSVSFPKTWGHAVEANCSSYLAPFGYTRILLASPVFKRAIALEKSFIGMRSVITGRRSRRPLLSRAVIWYQVWYMRRPLMP
jgi:hypothetical protein